MKKLLFYGLSICILLAMGCSNDSTDPVDDNPIDNSTGLTGNPFQDFPDNFLGSGDSANDILANTNYDRIEVQIAFVDDDISFLKIF